MASDRSTGESERSGVIVYDADGETHKVVLMDDNDEYLDLVVNPEQGVFGYENSDTSITMFIEEP